MYGRLATTRSDRVLQVVTTALLFAPLLAMPRGVRGGYVVVLWILLAAALGSGGAATA